MSNTIIQIKINNFEKENWYGEDDRRNWRILSAIDWCIEVVKW